MTRKVVPLIERSDQLSQDLRDLYSKIGYSPYVEKRAQEILNKLKEIAKKRVL